MSFRDESRATPTGSLIIGRDRRTVYPKDNFNAVNTVNLRQKLQSENVFQYMYIYISPSTEREKL